MDRVAHPRSGKRHTGNHNGEGEETGVGRLSAFRLNGMRSRVHSRHWRRARVAVISGGASVHRCFRGCIRLRRMSGGAGRPCSSERLGELRCGQIQRDGLGRAAALGHETNDVGGAE